jgi:AraC-like DNA-binding protein
MEENSIFINYEPDYNWEGNARLALNFLDYPFHLEDYGETRICKFGDSVNRKELMKKLLQHDCKIVAWPKMLNSECLKLLIQIWVETPAQRIKQNLLDYLAGIFDTNISRLERYFNKSENVTIVHYSMEYKIIVAKKLIQEGNLSIEEISVYLKYANKSYFTNHFKQSTGQTPGQYRKSIE